MTDKAQPGWKAMALHLAALIENKSVFGGRCFLCESTDVRGPRLVMHKSGCEIMRARELLYHHRWSKAL